ncbi:MAG TPA: hypothetical protein VM638_04580 [Actinomycetota bacterium]|nr:hypothetical protein [Actinomycetota bacterium]
MDVLSKHDLKAFEERMELRFDSLRDSLLAQIYCGQRDLVLTLVTVIGIVNGITLAALKLP